MGFRKTVSMFFNRAPRKLNTYKAKVTLIVFLVSGAVFILLTSDLPPSVRTDVRDVRTDSHVQHQIIRNKNSAVEKSIVDTNPSDGVHHNEKPEVKSNDIGRTISRNKTLWNELPPGTQMGKRQAAAIRKVTPPNGNLLVWGLGNDSPYWQDSTRGKVIFIEPAGFWFNKITGEYPYLEAYPVNYTTETVKSFEKYINNRTIWSDLDIRPQLPPVVTQTPWTVIIVDAPPGYRGAPGRYQSIYTSSLLARNGTHIFVDDYERKVEKQFSQKMLGTPVEVIKRSAKGVIGANEQAHFIHISD